MRHKNNLLAMAILLFVFLGFSIYFAFRIPENLVANSLALTIMSLTSLFGIAVLFLVLFFTDKPDDEDEFNF